MKIGLVTTQIIRQSFGLLIQTARVRFFSAPAEQQSRGRTPLSVTVRMGRVNSIMIQAEERAVLIHVTLTFHRCP